MRKALTAKARRVRRNRTGGGSIRYSTRLSSRSGGEDSLDSAQRGFETQRTLRTQRGEEKGELSRAEPVLNSLTSHLRVLCVPAFPIFVYRERAEREGVSRSENLSEFFGVVMVMCSPKGAAGRFSGVGDHLSRRVTDGGASLWPFPCRKRRGFTPRLYHEPSRQPNEHRAFRCEFPSPRRREEREERLRETSLCSALLCSLCPFAAQMGSANDHGKFGGAGGGGTGGIAVLGGGGVRPLLLGALLTGPNGLADGFAPGGGGGGLLFPPARGM